MEPNKRHVAVGIAAVIDSATVVRDRHVWMEAQELPDALDALYGLTNRHHNPEVYKSRRDRDTGRVCIKI